MEEKDLAESLPPIAMQVHCFNEFNIKALRLPDI
jgi:hypothetical protein